jgi:hypothetical protein
MTEGNWKRLSKYSIENRNGNRVNKIGTRYEVWYLVNGQYKHGGMHEDPEIAKQAAAKGIQTDASK